MQLRVNLKISLNFFFNREVINMFTFTSKGFSVYQIGSKFKLFKDNKSIGVFSNLESVLKFLGLNE